ncbi:Mediator complex, subunit Med10 [Klebsormidium nitens]|uniref:Mediator of RNA polymerase II transcription subunit 10 n=1 Tax=Klebsormidium nitens TaxID=105231 RepID=A0A1Y1HS47_KLENI|nr:Mediator complex, subunit Med10 [Klebsormidium nitens]|eukprot:GAQ79999.1 Mediator complex, subunit Med10 [Klebsormidium nitens]
MGTEVKRTERLAVALENALLEIHQLERTVMAYKESNQVLLFDRIDSFVKELKHVKKSAEGLDIEIPGEVVSLVDEGRNPDLYTREFLERCLDRNQATKGRVDAFKELRGHLLDNLDDAFPEEAQVYRDMKSAAADKLEKNSSHEQEERPLNGTENVAVKMEPPNDVELLQGSESVRSISVQVQPKSEPQI